MGRSVVATKVGGPPEFVTEEAGVLVDPIDIDAIAHGLAAAAALPCPNPAARAAAESHDVRRQAERIEEILARRRRLAGGLCRWGGPAAFGGFPPTMMMAYTSQPMIAPPSGPTM